MTYLPVWVFFEAEMRSSPTASAGLCFGLLTSERGVRLIGTLWKWAVCKRCCYFHLLRRASYKIFTSSLRVSNLSIFFSPLPLPSSGFLLSFHFWESCWQKLSLSSANLFGALARCVRLWRGRCYDAGKKYVCPFLRYISNF